MMINKKMILLSILLLFILFIDYQYIDLRLIKLVFNQARIIHKTDATIYGDNIKLENSFIFKYKDEHSEKIILYLENNQAYQGRNILIVDIMNLQIGSPNSNIRDYSKFGNFIYQNNSGENFIPFKSDSKRTYFDPELILFENEISFELPDGEGYKYKLIKIKQ